MAGPSLKPPGFSPRTLRGQAALRLALASLAVVLAASLTGAGVLKLVVSNSARSEARIVESFYANKLREWDDDWRRQAFRQSARLDFLDLAENPADREDRLNAYFVAQGEDQEFSQVFLVDASGRSLFQYGPDSGRLAGSVLAAQSSDWLYDRGSNRLYRVYHEPIWLGPDGMGRLILLRILDNALLYQNSTARTDLRLEWQDRTVAESLPSQGSEPASATVRVQASLPWPGGKSPAPVLHLSRVVIAPTGIWQAAAAVAFLLVLQALCIWGALGRWLVRVGQRVSLLGQASRGFARGWAGSGDSSPAQEPGAVLAIDPRVTDQDDEVADVARSLGSLVEAVARHDAQRLASQEEVGRLRNLLSGIVDAMPSALVTVDSRGLITRCNRRALTVCGLDEAGVTGMPVGAAFPRLNEELPRLLDAVKNGESWSGLKRPWRKDGETCFEEVAIYPLSGQVSPGAVIRLDDVTERVRMEQMMIQSAKMLSVGGLAAGMAHEINNPLGGILQSAQVIARRISPEASANLDLAGELGCPLETIQIYLERRGILEMLDGITDSARRAARIVADMLEFSRRGESPFAPAAIPDILDKAVELCSKDYDFKKRFDFRKIRIERLIDPDVPPVSCSSTQIEQVFMNLLRNAAQAMAENPESKPPAIILRVQREEEGEAVRVEVEDNGPGLSESESRRIFEPFYTTKAPGAGTGLGLSVSYFIVVENHGGSMGVESKAGQWTRFHVRLPIMPRP